MESIGNKIDTLADLLEEFNLAISGEVGNVNALYGKSVRSLTAFVGDVTSCPIAYFEVAISDWIISLRLRDFTLKTAAAYLKAVSGLYTRLVKAQVVPPVKVFKELRLKLKEADGDFWDFGLHRLDFERFRSLVRIAISKEESFGAEMEVMLLSLLNGCVPVGKVAVWKRQGLPDMSSASKKVIDRALKNAFRQYIFPFGRGGRTQRQAFREANDRVMRLLASRNIKTYGDADSTLLSYWSYAAMLSGIKPHELVRAMPEIPLGLPFLALCRQPDGKTCTRTDLNDSAVSMFSPVPERWYAMRLRPRVTFEDLKTRFDDERLPMGMPETFYPSREIAKRVGRKIVFEDRPYIHDVVFFKSRYDDISAMFNHIGDLAWCYKTTLGTGGKYAAVSRRSFEEFQNAIGRFTSECASTRPQEPALGEGDEVRITGDSCEGYTGEIVKIENERPDGILTYLVRVCNSLTSNFTVRVDSRMILKVSS